MGNTNLNAQVSGRAWFNWLGWPVLAFFLSTCGPGHGTDCLKSTGDIITQRRAVPTDLLTLTAYDNVDLKLVQDADSYAEVRCGENLIDNIEFKVNGRALDISNSSTCNWARSYDSPLEVTLHLPNIKNVFLRGQGNISTVGQFRQDTVFFHLVGAGDYHLNVNCQQLFIDQYEMGDVNIQGQTDGLDMTVGGTGRFFGGGLSSRVCFFRTTRDSNGDAHVRASGLLAGTVAGTGTLYYAGNPPLKDIRITGRGTARQE
jgi:hypothetical protein